MKEQRKHFRGLSRRPFAVIAAASVIMAIGPVSAASASNGNAKSNKQPITIGVVSDINGSAPTTAQPRYDAFIATVKWINANGGVNGHQINLVTVFDGGTEPGNLTATQNLIQNHNALITVHISGRYTGGGPWSSQQGIPLIATPQSNFTSMYKYIWSPNGGNNPDPTLWTANVAKFLKRHGFKKLGALTLGNNATAIQLGQDYVNSAPRAGMQKGYLNTTLPFGVTNWTPYVLGLQNTQTDVVVPTMALPDVLALMNVLRQQAPNIKVVAQILYLQSLLTGPTASTTYDVMQGTYVYTAANLAPTNPPVKKMANILKNYGDAINANPPGENEAVGYTTALLLKQALKGGGVNPTRSGIQKGMATLKHWDSGGIYGDIDFTKEHTAQAPTLLGNCLFFYQVRGTEFVPVPKKNNKICGPTIRLDF